jgi:hypothetical protein
MKDDAFGAYLHGELRSFLSSFKLGVRFLYVFLIEIGFLAALFVAYEVLSARLNSLSGQLAEVTRSLQTGIPSYDALLLDGAYGGVHALYKVILVNFAVFAAFAIVLWIVSRMLIYVVVNRSAISQALFWRFFVTGIVWFIVAGVVSFLYQMVVFNLFRDTLALSVWKQIAVLMLLCVSFILLFYLTISLLTPLVMSCSIRQALRDFVAVGLKKIRYALLPLLFELVAFVIFNIVLFVVILFPNRVFIILTTLLLLFYFVWLRFYNTAVFRRLSGGAASYRNPVHHALAHHAPAHQVPAHHTHHPKKR